MSYFLILLSLAAATYSLRNWRIGLLLCVAIAVLQDPIRKVTPGTPAFLTLAFGPVYFGMFLGLCSEVSPLKEFRRDFPQLKVSFLLLLMTLFASFIQTCSYGISAVPVACAGLFSYLGCFPSLLLGYFYLRPGAGILPEDFRGLDRLAKFFVALTTVMLIGVPLESMDVKFSLPWLGTIAMGKPWLRWYDGTGDVESGFIRMISGFYRSPEIMGWHAMMLVVLSIYLLFRNRQFFWVWAPTAAWGLYGVLMSGRRKMFLMILVYLGTFLITSKNVRRNAWIVLVLVASVGLSLLALKAVNSKYMVSAQSGLGAASVTVISKGILGPMELLDLYGPFGFGVGTKTQGTQHLSTLMRTPNVEGGLEKLFVEIGILGVVAVSLNLGALVYYTIRSLKRVRREFKDEVPPILLFSMLCANAAAFVVTFQIFGDPFVIFMVGFLGGVLLSVQRMHPGRPASPRRRVVAAAPPQHREKARAPRIVRQHDNSV